MSPEVGREIQDMEAIITRDPLYKLTERDIELLRKYKFYQVDRWILSFFFFFFFFFFYSLQQHTNCAI